MNKQIIKSIAKKEFLGFVNSVLAYVIIVPFLLISTFLYFRTALLVNDASLRAYFELLPWMLLFLAPALSMSLLSSEQSKGTLELLFGHPISELEIVLGKFLGVFSFFAVILLTTISLPITVILFSKPDLGIIISQYLGALFVGATFLSIGLASSAWVKNTIGSFLMGLSLSFGLILIGLDLVVLTLPWPFNRIAQEVAILPHMRSVARGVLDIRDLAYFVFVTLLFLILTTARLFALRTEESQKVKNKLNLAVALVLILGIAINTGLQFYPLRLDLTKNNLFTLSRGTKQTLKNLDQDVKITVYASRSLPGEIQLTLKDLDDLLRDYNKQSGRLQVEMKNPDTDADAESQAQQEGVQQVTFNKIGGSKFEVQAGYLGMVIESGGKKEVLPFIESTSDLEYQLTRRIRKLTASQEKIIGFSSNDYLNQYQYLKQALQTEYTVQTVDLESPKTATQAAGLIVIDSAEGENATGSANLKEYLKDNGKVLLMTKGVSINPQMLTVEKSNSQTLEILKDYGISINQDMVYDLQLNEPVTLGQGAVRYIIPYPFWLKALPADEQFSALANIQAITMGWPSSITTEEKEGVSLTKLLKTSLNAGIQEDNFTISPEEASSLADPKGKEIVLGVLAEKGETKLVVLPDFNLASDQFLQGSPQNLSLLSNLIDLLVAEKDVAAIPSKSAVRSVFRFTTENQAVVVQYTNILLPPFMVIGFAVYWLSRRKKMSLREYTS